VRLAALLLCALGVPVLSACGDTIQNKPIPHNVLEQLIVSPFPVYWAGISFKGLQITEASHDPGGAFSVQYGNCLQGGQRTCVPPLSIVTSPDNSFLPGGAGPRRSVSIRGIPAVAAAGGRTIVIPTGQVVVNIYASSSSLADAAAQTVIPINAPGSPQGPLPARLPDSGFGDRPLPSQTPSRLSRAH
jgi:hypothetical protein